MFSATRHPTDPVSLVGAVLFLSVGGAGLARGLGWIDHGAVLWAAVATVTALALVGATTSALGLRRDRQAPAPVDPPG